MKGISLLGGPVDLIPADFFENISHNRPDLLVGVDRGAWFLLEKGIVPNLAIGDFDSLKKKELTEIEAKVSDVRYSTPIKDLTDSELMLESCFQNYHLDNLTILGATGGRIDHFLVNLFTVLKPRFRSYAPRITIQDQQNILKFYLPGKHLIKPIADYKYVGVINLEAVTDLRIKDAKYELDNFTSTYPVSFASNEFKEVTEPFELSFSKGLVMIDYSRDINRFINI